MIKRLARCIREYKWPAILSPLCMIGEVAMEVLIPLVMADLYDYGIVMQNMNIVVTKSVQLIILALTSLSFGVASATFASKAGTGFAKNLRHDMFYRVQKFSFSNIDKFSSASIVTRLTSDVANLQMTFQMMIRMAIRCPMMLILAFISANRISLQRFDLQDRVTEMNTRLVAISKEAVGGKALVAGDITTTGEMLEPAGSLTLDELYAVYQEQVRALADAGADLLVLLSDIEGLYTADPRKNPDATLIPVVDDITPEILALAGGAGSSLGSGGMATKLKAANLVMDAGIDMVITNGEHPERLYALVDGDAVGTRFLGKQVEKV